MKVIPIHGKMSASWPKTIMAVRSMYNIVSVYLFGFLILPIPKILYFSIITSR